MRRTDARGVTTTNSYDALNRLTSTTYSDGTPTVTFEYDAVQAGCKNRGRLTRVVNGVSMMEFPCYDALGRATTSQQTTAGETFELGYSYDLADGLASQAYPSGRVVSFNRDAAGRLRDGRLRRRADDLLGYAPHGAPASLSLGAGVTATTEFNARLQPTRIAAGGLLTLTFGYGTTNNNGNVLSQRIEAPGFDVTQSYQYDGVNRLAALPGLEWVPGRDQGARGR